MGWATTNLHPDICNFSKADDFATPLAICIALAFSFQLVRMFWNWPGVKKGTLRGQPYGVYSDTDV